MSEEDREVDEVGGGKTTVPCYAVQLWDGVDHLLSDSDSESLRLRLSFRLSDRLSNRLVDDSSHEDARPAMDKIMLNRSDLEVVNDGGEVSSFAKK